MDADVERNPRLQENVGMLSEVKEETSLYVG